MVKLLEEMLEYNEFFVKFKEYEKYQTEDKYPAKRVVMFTCMDTRLVELSTKSLNLSSGDVKVVKNAGAILTHPFGSIMRSLVIAVYMLKADEIIVMGHYDCGMQQIDTDTILEKIKERGITEETLNTLRYSGIDLNSWLHGFDDVRESVRHDVDMITNHPLIPKDVPVHGLVINPYDGKVDLIENGYKRCKNKRKPKN